MQHVFRPDLIALAAHIAGASIFAGIFAFLYRESKVVYFSYWALAWGILSAALMCDLAWSLTGRALFLFPYALLELAFAGSLFFAGAAIADGEEIRIPSVAVILPALAVAGYVGGMFSGFAGFASVHSLLLTATYGWSFVASRRLGALASGSGRKLFGAGLLLAAAFSAHDALLYSFGRYGASSVPGYLRYEDLYRLLLETLLAFSAMMMWMESQHEKLRQANAELNRSRLQLARDSRVDPLTGLLNRTALNETCEANEKATGFVAVLDLDNFKDINDALGHLTGDDVLSNVGSLIMQSIRKEDKAWRWGGDEFVIYFAGQSRDAVEERLRQIEQKLRRFGLRGRGSLPIHVSWGAVEVNGGSLQQAIAEADQQMYLRKRDKNPPSKFFGD